MTNGLGGFSVELVGVFVGGGRVEGMAKSTRVMGGFTGCSVKLGISKPGGTACSGMEAFK